MNTLCVDMEKEKHGLAHQQWFPSFAARGFSSSFFVLDIVTWWGGGSILTSTTISPDGGR